MNVEVLHPQGMVVEFALFLDNAVLVRDTLFITKARSRSSFGSEVAFRTRKGKATSEASGFVGLLVEHEFAVPAATLLLTFTELVPQTEGVDCFEIVERFNAALQMGVHTSLDWESVALADFDLAFRCKPTM